LIIRPSPSKIFRFLVRVDGDAIVNSPIISTKLIPCGFLVIYAEIASAYFLFTTVFLCVVSNSLSFIGWETVANILIYASALKYMTTNAKIKENHRLLPRGQYSLDVILPAWWLKMHNLKAGSAVVVEASPAKVTITPAKEGDHQ